MYTRRISKIFIYIKLISKYIYIYKGIYVVKKTNNVPSDLLPIHQWRHGNSCPWAHNVWFGHTSYTNMMHVNHVSKCMSFHDAIGGLVITGRAHCLSFWVHIYYAHLTFLGFKSQVSSNPFYIKVHICIYIYIYHKIQLEKI